jgi:hypothetical protein
VLQKIAVGNLPGSASSGGGGSIKFALPINQNNTLTSSGYYFTDAIAANIGIDCINLGIGDHIYWQNLSLNAIVFSGLNSIDSVQIPANKGVKIASGNSIEFFLKDSNNNIKTLLGAYTIDWVHGYIPPTILFTYSSNGDTNGLIYWRGTNGYTVAFNLSNVINNFTVSATGTYESNISSFAVDRNNNTHWISTINNYIWKIDMGVGKSLQANNVTVRAASSGDNLQPFYLEGSNNDLEWTILNTSSSVVSMNSWINLFVSNATAWRYFRLRVINRSYFYVGEIEFYGTYYF